MIRIARVPARVRRDVQSLLAEGVSGRKVLEDYARGIEAMRKRDNGPGDPKDPLSWRFQAAIHGFPGLEPSLTHPMLWGSCRHNSWFFLPWHRVYLRAFERIVQHHIGDDGWSLPYWDYTKHDDDTSRILPEPFRVPQRANALYTGKRHPQINDPEDPVPVPFQYATADAALKLSEFALTGEHPEATFAGGVVDDVAPVQAARGSLEGTPHGQVHGVVGGDSGLMSRFETAALDPIFWLHHANIDRLWEVWIKLYGADALPDGGPWLATKFPYFDIDGTKKELAIGDIVVTENLGYVYESTDPPGHPAVMAAIAARAPLAMEDTRLVGAASDVPFATRADVDIDLEGERQGLLAAAARNTPSRWYLRVEDVRGRNPATPAYDVYLNDRRVGSIASFGIPEATEPRGEHAGTGLTDVFDITDAVADLDEEGAFDPSKVTVTVMPGGLPGEGREGGDVRAGRISIYAG
jgi:tyrosinase